MIHEQNAVAGLTNRWLSRFASRIAEGFPGSFPAGRGAIYVGNPVRPEIAALPPPRQRFDARSGALRLFVFGGSQGASSINRLVPAAVALLPESRRPIVLHQTGTRDRESTEAAYRAAGVQADVRAFVDDMAGAYAEADLVVSRAGALTVAELAASGVGAILIPFPAAVDDHQTRNAEWLGRICIASKSDAAVLSERLARDDVLALRAAGIDATEQDNRLVALQKTDGGVAAHAEAAATVLDTAWSLRALMDQSGVPLATATRRETDARIERGLVSQARLAAELFGREGNATPATPVELDSEADRMGALLAARVTLVAIDGHGQIVFANDAGGHARVGFGGMQFVGLEEGRLVFVRIRELFREDQLSPARSHTMRLDPQWVATISVDDGLIWPAGSSNESPT